MKQLPSFASRFIKGLVTVANTGSSLLLFSGAYFEIFRHLTQEEVESNSLKVYYEVTFTPSPSFSDELGYILSLLHFKGHTTLDIFCGEGLIFDLLFLKEQAEQVNSQQKLLTFIHHCDTFFLETLSNHQKIFNTSSPEKTQKPQGRRRSSPYENFYLRPLFHYQKVRYSLQKILPFTNQKNLFIIDVEYKILPSTDYYYYYY